MVNSQIFTGREGLFTPRKVMTEVLPTVHYRLEDNQDLNVDSSSQRAEIVNAPFNSRPDQSRFALQFDQNSSSSIEENSPRNLPLSPLLLQAQCQGFAAKPLGRISKFTSFFSPYQIQSPVLKDSA